VIHSYADGRIEDTGPLTRKRMETADDEFRDAAVDFMKRAVDDDKPFFVWLNSTRMHVWTRLSDEWDGKTGHGLYADGMAQHDYDIGIVLDKLDEWGIADNTIVVYSTDNGAEKFTWPDGGTIPFRGEKGTTWEGGFRVPAAVRWPGLVKPGTVVNDIFSHEDWVPTLMAAAGDPDIKEKLKAGGHSAAGKTFRTHLDGYDQRGVLAGTDSEARKRRSLPQLEDPLHHHGRRHQRGLPQEPQLAAGGQPAAGSVRGHPRRGPLHPLAGRPDVALRAGAGVRRPVPADLQGVPAQPGGELAERREGPAAAADAGSAAVETKRSRIGLRRCRAPEARFTPSGRRMARPKSILAIIATAVH
jgi:hypothetical protein